MLWIGANLKKIRYEESGMKPNLFYKNIINKK